MSWWAIAAMAAGAFGFKVLGVLGFGQLSERLASRLAPLAALIPAALFSALVAVQTFGDGRSLTIDARLCGVGVGLFAVWRRAPFVVVVLAAMTATALVRWQTIL